MIDFLTISTRSPKRGVVEIYPKFIIKKSNDLMIRGGDFYAIWIEERGLWSTDEQDVIQLIDAELDRYLKDNRQYYETDTVLKVLHMWDSSSGMIDSWHKYCQKQMRDSFCMLDEHIVFANTKTSRKDYASKKLPYALDQGDISAYDRLMSVLYSESERNKIEWAIGAIVSGESKGLQKFMVFYGASGTGKSTIINIIELLFEGYFSVFDAKALGSSNNSFALESFRTNPLVAIQHDGDLSRIEDNTRLNSLVSHELMTVNEKFKTTYANKFKAFLFMGTNKPVKITDAKSGLIRRLIDVSPTGNKVPQKEYEKLVKQVRFELGAIAYYCKDIYLSDPCKYDDYIPIGMLSASNDFYNYVLEAYFQFRKEDSMTLKQAWEFYKTYCDEAKVPYPHPQRIFKEELKNYFWEYYDRYGLEDGTRVRSYYVRFRLDKLDITEVAQTKHEEPKLKDQIVFDSSISILDSVFSHCPAQYSTSIKDIPANKWDKIITTLSNLNTSKMHYVRLPENHIVIDFDLRDDTGDKSLERSLEEANKWPPTYAEISKGGNGIHLHYNYTGDVSKLAGLYSDHVEVLTFTGKKALRRRLTKCNNLPIATLSSGLPLKGEKMVSTDVIKSEAHLRRMIIKNLNKEILPSTKSSIDFIHKNLEDAYDSGIHYNVSDMASDILAFAAQSTNQSEYCIKLLGKMKLQSDNPSESVSDNDRPIAFYDVEVFPNLFICNYKILGPNNKVTRLINPSPTTIQNLITYRLIGFNCRRYDNHILYARLMGYDNARLYDVSKNIIDNAPNCYFGEAYNISYTDVYDFASAGNKMGLKKWEIKLGIHHQELGLPWDQPVPEYLWEQVAEYCDNDVIATEAVFEHLKADWTARQILADLAGMTVNDTTNALTTKIIFGGNRAPQNEFEYRDLAEPVTSISEDKKFFLEEYCPEMMAVKHGPRKDSLLPYFPGYNYKAGKSTYRGITVGEGGRVFARPDAYGDIALLDVISMHPHSAIAEMLFGFRYTSRFRELVYGRVEIKAEDWDEIDDILEGKLSPYVQKVKNGEMTSGQLADGLKTAINSVYGLTAATFDNPFHDPKNIDNIVAKRGALFMVDLEFAVRERGFQVAHVKTDSIKIPDATPEIIEFVKNFGKLYGYTFDHEATYDKMCLVNDAVYIARYAKPEKCQQLYGYVPKNNKKYPYEWTATGTQFAVPYVFKTLFSKEEIVFEDLCETMSVTTALYLDLNEDLPDVSGFEKELGKLLKQNPPKADDVLINKIAEGHDYHFVGRVGQFCPMKPGAGGGILLRESVKKDGSIGYGSANGAKDYRWLESETVRLLKKENQIDLTYYGKMVAEARESIFQYCGVEWFCSDKEYNFYDNEIIPF